MTAIRTTTMPLAAASTRLPALCALALALLPLGVRAESSPYYVGAGLGLTHVSNIYRLGDGSPVNNDWVTSTSLLAGLDQQIGRQRFFGDASWRYYRYRSNGQLDNSAYQLNLGLDWQALDKWSGNVTAYSSRTLAQFNPGDKPTTTQKNELDNQQLNAAVRYGLAGKLSLEFRGGLYRDDYSLSLYSPYNYRQWSDSLGLIYKASDLLQLGAAVRHAEGRYPQYLQDPVTGVYLPQTVERNDLDFSADWKPSAVSTLSARLSLGRSHNSALAIEDYSGLTGLVSWQWRPLSKLLLSTSLSRDTGFDSSSALAGLVRSENNRVSTSLRLGADYELTSKIRLSSAIAATHRELAYNSSTGTPLLGTDDGYSLTLGGVWIPTRNSQLSCQYSFDDRRGVATPLSIPFTASSVGCSGVFYLR